MTYSYSLYRLKVNLPFHCEFLLPAKTDATPDVTVRYGTVPMDLQGAIASEDSWKFGSCWQAAPGRFLLKGGQRSGRFLVEDGNRVTVKRNSEAKDERLLLHFLHPVSAALFRQRGVLALHASAVNVDGGAIVLCGKSGAGKSSTLAAMLRNGTRMISDDLTILHRSTEGLIEIVPGPSMLHLWDHTAHALDIDTSRLHRHPGRRCKIVVPTRSENGQPAPLRKLFIIEPCPEENISVLHLSGTEKFDALIECIHGPFFLEEHPDNPSFLSAAARQVDIFRIRRPEHRWSLDEVVKVILDQ